MHVCGACAWSDHFPARTSPMSRCEASARNVVTVKEQRSPSSNARIADNTAPMVGGSQRTEPFRVSIANAGKQKVHVILGATMQPT